MMRAHNQNDWGVFNPLTNVIVRDIQRNTYISQHSETVAVASLLSEEAPPLQRAAQTTSEEECRAPTCTLTRT
jgi:hypothetical protein